MKSPSVFGRYHILRNPPSLDSFPSDSVRTVASSLDIDFSKLHLRCVRTALPRAITSRLAWKEF
jgi:hypothetical protein